jgi:hypothetical protein
MMRSISDRAFVPIAAHICRVAQTGRTRREKGDGEGDPVWVWR